MSLCLQAARLSSARAAVLLLVACAPTAVRAYSFAEAVKIAYGLDVDTDDGGDVGSSLAIYAIVMMALSFLCFAMACASIWFIRKMEKSYSDPTVAIIYKASASSDRERV